MSVFHIAIDGPSGAGKSSTARRLASELGFTYMDTGAMYRAVGLKALRLGIDPGDEEAVSEMIRTTSVDLSTEGGEQQVLLDGENVNPYIRTQEVSSAASTVSKWAAVRTMLVDAQRSICASSNVIMDGRDIGSVVLPNAQVKFFLTASPEVRARRRTLELRARGEEADEARILREIIERDEQDTHRAVSPLVRVPDAILVDNSEMDEEETCQWMLKTVRERMGK